MGQFIGEGRQRLTLPGLNAHVKSGDRITRHSQDTIDASWYDSVELIVLKITND